MTEKDEGTLKFIQRCKTFHNNKFNYDKTVYKGHRQPIIVTCPVHGDLYLPRAEDHLRYGCRACGILSATQKRRHTTESWISEGIRAHGTRYDYSESIYVNSGVKIKIICREHGAFYQTPSDHIRNKNPTGCPKCGGNQTYDTPEYIRRCTAAHNGKFNYDKTIYTGSTNSVIITCPEHGDFSTKAAIHLAGHDCPKCADLTANNKTRFTTEEYVAQAILIRGDEYDYSRVVYTHSNEKVEIICRKHGSFFQRAAGHLQGDSCPECAKDIRREATMLTPEERLANFLPRSKERHGELYDYSVSEPFDRYSKVAIRCRKHGVFYQDPGFHIGGGGCPRCSESKGERTIANILDVYRIEYIREYKIPGYKFKYDFYLPDFDTYIEFHGRQHFEFNEFFHRDESDLERIQRYDQIKVSIVKGLSAQFWEFTHVDLNEGNLEEKLIDSLDYRIAQLGLKDKYSNN